MFPAGIRLLQLIRLTESEKVSMTNRLFTLLLTLMFLTILLAGCSQESKPEEVYWQYYEACSDGRFDDARQWLTETAVNTSRSLGVCAFTHDAINVSEAQKGNPLRTFSDDPTLNQQERLASLTWFDDQGNIASVVLVEVDGEWKVTEATWSY
jgi:hypothetical protein